MYDTEYKPQLLSEPAAADRLGIGFGWLQNAWLLHARLKIHRGGIDTRSVASTENPRAGSLSNSNSYTPCTAVDVSHHPASWAPPRPRPAHTALGLRSPRSRPPARVHGAAVPCAQLPSALPMALRYAEQLV
jgi:hypothetical protein